MTDLMAFVTRTGDTGTVTLDHVCRAGVADTWEAVTQPERLARWMSVVTGDLREGGSYHIAFDPEDAEAVVAGTIERCVPERELVVSWQAPGDPVSRVSVTFSEQDGGTRLHLVHEGLETVSDVGHAAGWQVHVEQLEEELAGNGEVDLWHRWTDLRDAYLAQLNG